MRRTAFLPIFLLLALPALAAEEPRTGTFSDMYYNEAGGDLLGTEVRIVYGREGHKVVFQTASGIPDDPVVVDARFTDGFLEFALQAGQWDKPAHFRGRIVARRLMGTLTDEDGGEEKLDLPRRAGYWDQRVFE